MVIMFSLGVKIQILLFMLVVLVGLYLFILQKEMRLMQHDLGMLKSGLTEMCKHELPTEQQQCVVQHEDVDEDEEEEEDSVSSKEIKEMLTNITLPEEDEKVEEDAEEESNYALYEESELEKVKCEDLRNYLKKQGVDSKGKKPDLVKRVLDLSL